jgi:superfamily II RNA helicase
MAMSGHLPAIIFSFSRDGCDKKATNLEQQIRPLISDDDVEYAKQFAT